MTRGGSAAVPGAPRELLAARGDPGSTPIRRLGTPCFYRDGCAGNGGGPLQPPNYSLMGRSAGISYPSRLSSYRLSSRRPIIIMFLWGSRASPRALYPAWRLGAVTRWVSRPVKIFLPGGCLPGEGRAFPGFVTSGRVPACSTRAPSPWAVILGQGPAAPPRLTSPGGAAGGPSSLKCTFVRGCGYLQSHYANSSPRAHRQSVEWVGGGA